VLHLLERILTENRKAGLGAFDELPQRMLPVAAEQCAEELLLVLRLYVRAVDEHVESRQYTYAENVAKKMNVIFGNTSDPELRTLALQAALIAAVRKNRFAAMDLFKEMVTQVSADEALPVAEMLRDNLRFFRVVAGPLEPHELRYPIRLVREEAMGQ
jgi:hypothetical protein